GLMPKSFTIFWLFWPRLFTSCIWGVSSSTFQQSRRVDLIMNDSNLTGRDNASDAANWKQIVAHYQKPSVARAVWQLVNTLVPYIGLWALMRYTVTISWWLTIPLAVLAGAILVRAFIIFHDCGHGSFFKSSTANHIFGAITGVFTFTPFYHWR